MINAQINAAAVHVPERTEQLVIRHIDGDYELRLKVVVRDFGEQIVIFFGNLVTTFHAYALTCGTQCVIQRVGAADGVAVGVLVGENDDILGICQHRGGCRGIDHTAHCSSSLSSLCRARKVSERCALYAMESSATKRNSGTWRNFSAAPSSRRI